MATIVRATTENEEELTFLNLVIAGQASTTTATEVQAETYVSRSGPIVERSDEYYVSIIRLKFVVDIPIAIAPIGPNFAADGVSTDWSLTVRYTDAASTVFTGRAFLKVLPQTVITGMTTQPKDLYMGIWTLMDWQSILNTALAAAYAACDAAAGGGILPVQVPFFSIADAGTGRMKLTCYPFDDWNIDSQAGGKKRLELFCNWSAFPAFGGWDLIRRTVANQPLSASGGDYQFNIRSTGYNYLPVNPPGAPPALLPTGPATATLILEQTSPNFTMPGITKINFITNLSTLPEYTPGGDGRNTSLILTDQSPDLSQILLGDSRTSFVYNTGLKDARWARLVGGPHPISTVMVRVTMTDWFGNEIFYYLSTRSQTLDMKLAFAPKKLVDNWATR